MGKINKKGHNWKARKQKSVVIDKTEEANIKLDLNESNLSYDESNPLVLPAEKRKTKTKGEQPVPVKKLSRKQRRRLEKIIEQKEKKQKRAGLLEALKNVQVSKDELSQLHSTTELHSQTYKRHADKVDESEGSVNAISGSNKTKRRKVEPEQPEQMSSSESSDSEEEEEEEDMTEQQREKDLNVDEESNQKNDIAEKDNSTATATTTEKVQPKSTAPSLPTVHVPVLRKDKIQEERLRLPILAEEQTIMETITENPVTILCGETGSGKTTQVPQFLYEAGYARGSQMIAVTEPRRVAAISMSQRVATEMNLTSREVSYQIRYEGNVTPDTKIKFLTDGVLLKEVQKDFLLSSYSAVIIDEAHERSMYTDILIGLLSRIVPLRNKKGQPLKLIIMSATLRVEDFTENKILFKRVPPVVKVDSRQFPVTIHFNKRTPEDYLGEAFKKICKIHRELPEGGILVFVTGQQEVHTLSAKLKRKFPQKQSPQDNEIDESKDNSQESCESTSSHSNLPSVSLDDYSIVPEEELAEHQEGDLMEEASDDSDLDDKPGVEDDDALQMPVLGDPLYVLPLYSLLSTIKQQRVFKPPPDGCRLCVVATNVAETSITIPGIRYVVDTGKTKTKFYDKVTGVSAFKVTWTSKASANQRAGRAGRTGPGHCYRLYSSAVFNNDLEQFSPPEIVRRPVEDLVLQMKAMCIDKVVNFPFPTPPESESLQAAEKLLTALGALEVTEKGKSSRITALGKTMAAFPVSPRFGKMLALAEQQDLLVYVVALVSALSVQELLVETPREEMGKQSTQTLSNLKRIWAGVGESLLLGDMSVLLRAVGACEYAGGGEKFCAEHHIRWKAMVEVRKLRRQLTNTVNTVLPSASLAIDPKLSPPTDLQCKLLRQILLSGLGDRVARKAPAETLGSDGKKLRFAYKCTSTNDYVYIHPSSVLYKHQPKLIVYQSLEETTKLYMKGISTLELEWFPVFVPTYCMFSKPLDEPKPTFDSERGQVMCHMTSTFGPQSWPVPVVELPYPQGLERFKWFAVFLLDGSVCPALRKFTASLLSLPVTMVRSWAKLQPRTEGLLRSLSSRNIFTREALHNVWSKEPRYLLAAYKEWLPEILHSQIEDIWPPLESKDH